MNMIFLSSDLQKMYFISIFYFTAYLLYSFIYLFCDYYFPIFCRTYYMIYQHGHIMALVYEFTHSLF